MSFQVDAFENDAFQVIGEATWSLYLDMSIADTFTVDDMPGLSASGEGIISNTFTVDDMPGLAITDRLSRGWKIYVED